MSFPIKFGQSSAKAASMSKICRKIADAESLTFSEFRILEECLSELGLDPQADGVREGYLVAHGDLDGWFNDQRLADHLDLSDSECRNISDDQRLEFARDLLRNLGDALDADIHPGLILVEATYGDHKFFLGYAITGYSFSGLECSLISYGEDPESVKKRLESGYLLIDDMFFMPGMVEDAVGKVSDQMILSNWSRFK